MSVSMLKSSPLHSASVASGLLKCFLGAHPLLPATYEKCGLTTSCRRTNLVLYFRHYQKRLSSHRPATCQPPTNLLELTNRGSNPIAEILIPILNQLARPPVLKKSNVPRSSKSTTQKREKPEKPRELEPWQIQKQALKKKFPEGWNPRKRLHPDTLDTIRHLHQQDPNIYSTPALAQEFKVSPEAIRRILKSKWQPTPEVAAERRERWEKRRKRIWNQLSEIGVRPHRPSFADVSDTKVLEKKRRTVGSK
ncbi:mitochondrion organization and biogenesis protein [Blastomyces dermatitidis ATCC 18188]|uniref:Required for respiratory growth protein 9, mitochondrial n=1 Tax=Ajellomyces dermatitidis (strain ATCC 18188 / CBS 674.68) TaxID=653446 RepID=F2T356_AJEDA|nr:mitochondrion organization and biogenesis protein [Blastomyces dermatitidis ATCC 18188]